MDFNEIFRNIFRIIGQGTDHYAVVVFWIPEGPLISKDHRARSRPKGFDHNVPLYVRVCVC